MRYLMPISQKSLYINFEPTIKEIKKGLRKGLNKFHCWIGRNNIIKMVYFAKILHLMQSLPVGGVIKYLRQVNKIFSEYLGNMKRPRTKKELLKQEETRHRYSSGQYHPHSALVVAVSCCGDSFQQQELRDQSGSRER